MPPLTLLFTEAEEEFIKQAAQEVWAEIGYDVLRDSENKVMPRDEVVELVCDAGRLEDMIAERLRRRSVIQKSIRDSYVDPGLVGRVRRCGTIIHRIVKAAFKHERYGL